MENRWTGGQYSLFRVFLGAAALLGCFHLYYQGQGSGFWAPAALPGFRLSPGETQLWLASILGVLASLLLAVGRFDRVAAWFLFFVLPWLNLPGLVTFSPIHLLLVVHLLLPPAPYGSLAAVGRPDPGNGWVLSPGIMNLLWVFLAALWLASAVQPVLGLWSGGDQGGSLARGQTQNSISTGFGLCFIALALMAPKVRARPYILGASLVLTSLLTPLNPGLILLHLLAFDPGHLKRAALAEPILMFYDGYCGLCHRATRFAMAEDPEGLLFRFAPLQGSTIGEKLTPQQILALPDSVVILDSDGSLKVKSRAVILLLNHLGGFWRLFAWLARLVPSPVRDGLYDLVAVLRHRIFPKPAESCPIVPAPLRARFLP